jgi:hypothetical protein
MDFVFYPGDYIVKGIEPFLATITGAECLVLCFCQHPNDVLTLVLHPILESFDACGCNDVL